MGAEELLVALEEEVKCDPNLGKMVLQFTGGDVDGAAQILKSLDKEIFILRGKFIGQIRKLYGSFFIVYNAKLKECALCEFIAVNNEKSGIEFDFRKDWREYLQDLRDYRDTHVMETEICDNFLNLLSSPLVHSFFESRFLLQRKIEEGEVQKFFSNRLINILGDVNVALKLKIDNINVFELNYKEEKADDFPEKKETEQEINDTEIVTLNVTPEISPVSGTALSELTVGDRIGIRINDSRIIASYISSLLETRALTPRADGLFFFPLKEVKKTKNAFHLIVEFGPGVYGKASCAEDFKIAVQKELNEMEEEADEELGETIFLKYFWIIGSVLVTMLIVMFLFMIFFNN